MMSINWLYEELLWATGGARLIHLKLMAAGIIDIVSAGVVKWIRYGVIYVDADNLGNGSYKRYKKIVLRFIKISSEV